MAMFYCSDLSIGLPRHLLWQLITDTTIRHLWQHNIVAARQLNGDAGAKGSMLSLEAREGGTYVQVTERVSRCRLQDSFVAIQQWPKHEIHNKYIFTAQGEGSTLLTVQKRFKGQIRFALLGKQLTRRQLESATMQELISLKNLSEQFQTCLPDSIAALKAGSE